MQGCSCEDGGRSGTQQRVRTVLPPAHFCNILCRYLQGVLRAQIQERIEGHEGVVRDVNAALAEMANQLLKLRDEVSSQLRLSAGSVRARGAVKRCNIMCSQDQDAGQRREDRVG